ncbi:MAG: type II toxin-antitoxin system RelE/ParE family toxin [Dongiaceae bacterium]
MKLVWSARASADLDDIESYLETRNLDAAIATIDRLTDAVELLRQFSSLGRIGHLAGTRELVVTGTAYFIVYRVRPEAIDIVAVIHAMREFP